MALLSHSHRLRAAVLAGLVCAGAAAPARAQGVRPGPPGPYVIDVRGVSLGLPSDGGFYPALPEDSLVPSRGFGIEAGAHVYLGGRGPGRLGVGASVFHVRGTAGEAVSQTVRILAPQVSLNFGTSEGWSYVSAGVGAAQVRGRFDPGGAGAVRSSGARLAINLGGGARWFVTRHAAIGFDLRLHRIGAGGGEGGGPGTPAALLGSASVGLSLK